MLYLEVCQLPADVSCELKLFLADKEHADTVEFRNFRRHLYHQSIAHILEALRPYMTTPDIVRYADGHYRRTIYVLGPYIADYPEQVLLACIVSGWCPKCDSPSHNLDNIGNELNVTPRSHQLTRLRMDALSEAELWDGYGIVSDILVRPFISVVYKC